MKIALKCTYVEMASPGRGKPKERMDREPGTVIDLPNREAASLVEKGLADMAEPEADDPASKKAGN